MIGVSSGAVVVEMFAPPEPRAADDDNVAREATAALAARSRYVQELVQLREELDARLCVADLDATTSALLRRCAAVMGGGAVAGRWMCSSEADAGEPAMQSPAHAPMVVPVREREDVSDARRIFERMHSRRQLHFGRNGQLQ